MPSCCHRIAAQRDVVHSVCWLMHIQMVCAQCTDLNKLLCRLRIYLTIDGQFVRFVSYNFDCHHRRRRPSSSSSSIMCILHDCCLYDFDFDQIVSRRIIENFRDYPRLSAELIVGWRAFNQFAIFPSLETVHLHALEIAIGAAHVGATQTWPESNEKNRFSCSLARTILIE